MLGGYHVAVPYGHPSHPSLFSTLIIPISHTAVVFDILSLSHYPYDQTIDRATESRCLDGFHRNNRKVACCVHPRLSTRPHQPNAKTIQTPTLQRLPHNFCKHRVQPQAFAQVQRAPLPRRLAGLPLKTIPDGLPPSDPDATQDIPSLCDSTTKTCLPHFRELLYKLNDPVSSNGPPVTCIVSDGVMSFTLKAAEEFGVLEVLFWTPSACGFLGYTKYKDLVEKGLVPLKDASYLTNGYLETTIDWIQGMENIRFKDLPSFIRTTNPNDLMVNFVLQETEAAVLKASAIILNTFDAFEKPVLESLSSFLPPIYTLGPLQLLVNQVSDERLKSMHSNLWKEESQCIDWLDTKKPNSVLYVNFGSITVMMPKQLEEFAWGLANSGNDFLWIISPDLVVGESAMLPPEFVMETEGRGILANWCPQERVLNHEAIAGFLTHSGWNSTLESVCGGVPVICWPFFAEQQTNCWFSCGEWGIGMEIDNNVRREEVENLSIILSNHLSILKYNS